MSAASGVETPAPIRTVVRRLAANGVHAWLAGPCIRKLLCGLATRDFAMLCDAPFSTLVETFDRAIPIPRNGVVVLPTEAGVCELRPLGANASLTDTLATHDASIHAIAWDPRGGRWCDPFGGRDDLAGGRLRGVGDCEAGLRRHPIRLLRMGRLVATLGVSADTNLRRSMSAAAPVLAHSPKPPFRRELEALLLGKHAGDGLRLLRETGVEAQLAPGCDEGAAAWVDALPRELPLRLVAWLYGSDPQVAMGPLRFGEARCARVARLIARHPIDGKQDGVSLGAVKRVLARTGEAVVRDLLVLREAQFEARGTAPPASLQQIRDHVERARNEATPMLGRHDLALSGREIMSLLEIPPGPRVGEVINWLIAEVERDPAKNSAAALRALLAVAEGERT